MKPSLLTVYFLFTILVSGCVSTTKESLEPKYRFGIIEHTELETIDEPDHIAGKHSFGEAKTIKKTDTIKIKQGRTFGIEFKLPDIYQGQEVLVKQIVEFPDGSLTNPKTNKTSDRVTLESLDYYFEEPYLLAYILDQPWEMKKGKWKFSVFLNEREFIKHEFTLY